MLTGDTAKTTSFKIEFWWPTEGVRDIKVGNAVGTWIGQNAKALDKKRSLEVVKLIQEQFPYLEIIEARHANLQYARWQR